MFVLLHYLLMSRLIKERLPNGEGSAALNNSHSLHEPQSHADIFVQIQKCIEIVELYMYVIMYFKVKNPTRRSYNSAKTLLRCRLSPYAVPTIAQKGIVVVEGLSHSNDSIYKR